VAIFQPTINILGGNTPEGFAKAFPPEMIGTGFLSRMVLVHGKRSNRRYTFPPVPPQEKTDAITAELSFIRSSHYGVASGVESTDTPAGAILDCIYREWEEIDDVRFKSYSNRRFTQLLKLCLIQAAASGSKTITEEVVIKANTVLAAAEAKMPLALGEFGKSKNADVAHKVMEILLNARKPVEVKDIWQQVHNDLEKPTQLGEILQGLAIAEKAQHVKGRGWLPKQAAKKQQEFVDFGILTEEERV
jgi:hypothetical protein